MVSLSFIITALVIVLIPGTGVIYTINTGLTQNRKYTIAAALGCTMGIIPHMTACIFGLSAIMHMSAKVFTVIKYLGAGYLLYLAWKTWSTAGSMEFDKQKKDASFLKVSSRGILLNLLNPKLTLFFLSFLPQFIPTNTSNELQNMLILSLIFMLMTLIVFIGYGLLANGLSNLVQRRKEIMKNIEKGFALVFAGLAVKLAFEDK